MDARFGKPEIISRIKKIGRYSNRIHLYNLDALEFTKQIVPTIDTTRRFAFYDPPYIENGADLYLNDYTIDGHRKLSDEVSKLAGAWVVTYDYSAVRHDLYSLQRRMVYGLSYTAQSRYEGKEVMFFSDDLKLPASWTKSARILLNAEKSDHPVYGLIEKRAPKRSTVGAMKPPPMSPEFSKFTSAMRQILTVSKAEMESRINAQKQNGKRLSKPTSRVSASVSNFAR